MHSYTVMYFNTFMLTCLQEKETARKKIKH